MVFQVFDEVDRVMKESEAVLEEIQCYKVRSLQFASPNPITHPFLIVSGSW